LSASPVTETITRPDIFAFHDYREYLGRWFSYLKNLDESKTLRAISRDSELSPGYLPLVLSGQRSLTTKSLKKILPQLSLKPNEQSYLKLLVNLGEARTQEGRSQALRQIQRFGSYKNNNNRELEVHKYLSHWYLVAIRELVSVAGFEWDAKWIQGKLTRHVGVYDIEKAMAFLLQHGFVIVDKDNKATLPSKSLKCEGGIYQIALGDYHREMLQLAAESIDSTEKDLRSLTGYTFAVKKENLDEVKKILADAQNKIVELEQKQKSADAVYHVELSFFPLSED
jgi:uncharacterized protein (TIGR02147 family)